jgi:pantoate--beta-alanine ligase
LRTIKSLSGMRGASEEARGRGSRIGFVPTMGFLHEGHLSLIDRAAGENDLTVVSIFVNPLQFGPSEDFRSYPSDLKRDKVLARDRGCDLVFVPAAESLYPPGFRSAVRVKELENKLCGKTRPGHFEGVCTVVMKLLNVVSPHALYLGQKDAQQAIILKRMVKDMAMDVSVKACPIVREPDGLAMSSRNVYLTKQQREQAPVLRQALLAGARSLSQGETDPVRVRKVMRAVLRGKQGARLDYIEAVDPENLERPRRMSGRVLLAGAVWFGRTRLIDNIMAKVGAGRR